LEDIQFHLDGYEIIICMVLDPQLSLKQVESCQSEDPTTINDFKQLWGQKSELRRFKDGSIYESVVFDNNQSLHQKSLTVARMTAFLLKRHFQLDEDDGVTYWAGLGNKYLKEVGNEELGFEIVNEQYGKICRELRSLDLPLAVNRFHIIDDKLVQSSIIIPEPVLETDLKSRSQPIEFLMEFEFSAKWPDELQAIETMKRAFLIKICTESEDKEYSCKVGVDDKNQSFLDINFNGYLFRMRILHQRIQYLLERSLLEADSKTKDDLSKYDKEYKTIYSRTPIHYQLLQPLIYRYTFLGDSIRLLKRWFSCQLALGYIGNDSNSMVSPQVIELLCVHVYSQPGVYSVPASAFTGFCRALELLSTHKWDREPLMVELERGKLTKDLSKQIQDNFDSLTKTGTPFASFIATELDLKSEWWNTLKINPKVWQRIIMLSSESCTYIKTQLSTAQNNNIEKLFVTNTQGFDFMIQLNPTLIIDHLKQIHPKIEFKSKSKFKNVVSKPDLKTIQYSRYDLPKEYLKNLREVYFDKILFFGDRMGGDQIFGKILWKGDKFGVGMGNLKLVVF
jgi:U3 small nucleolar RNA-associated protein 22